MIALLYSLVCNVWSMYCAHTHAAQPTRQHGDFEQSIRQQLGANCFPCCCHGKATGSFGRESKQKEVRHHQQAHQRLSDQTPQAGLAATKQTPSSTDMSDVESFLHQQQCEHGAPLQLMHQEQPATSLAQVQPLKLPDDQSQQLLPAPPEQLLTSLLPGARAWHTINQSISFNHTATQTDVQVLYLKMVLCAILLSALPCVAWFKQPRHMRQWACWQDALPAAAVALHASICTLWVSSCSSCHTSFWLFDMHALLLTAPSQCKNAASGSQASSVQHITHYQHDVPPDIHAVSLASML